MIFKDSSKPSHSMILSFYDIVLSNNSWGKKEEGRGVMAFVFLSNCSA